MIKVYGIPNCNTVKKGLDWLKENQVEYEFHDFKKKGITKEKLEEWVKSSGWEKLVNKKGTTWRTLPVEEQQEITNKRSAIKLMIEKPSIIKRPVIELDGKLFVGFDESQYSENFKKTSAG